MNTTDTQPQHGQTVSSPDPGRMTPWSRRAYMAYKTRRAFRTVLRPVRRGLPTVGGLAADGFIAWFQAYINLTYYFLTLVVGVFVGVGISQPLVPTSWALHRTWEAHYGLFGVWAIAGVFAALHNWYTTRTATPTANLDDVADNYDKLTDRITEINGQLASLDDRGHDNTAVLEQVVDSLDAIRRQLAQGGAS